MLWWTGTEYGSSHSMADRRLLHVGVGDYYTLAHIITTSMYAYKFTGFTCVCMLAVYIYSYASIY